jgi:hypothetical protein
MTPSHPDALGAFVQQLVETSFTLISIVEAMVRYQECGHSSADAPPIPDALREVLASAFTSLSERAGDEGLTTATRVLGDATDLMCSDIYVVEPDRMARRARKTRTRGAH